MNLQKTIMEIASKWRQIKMMHNIHPLYWFMWIVAKWKQQLLETGEVAIHVLCLYSFDLVGVSIKSELMQW